MPETIADKLERVNQARIDIGNAVLTVGGTARSTDGLEKQPTNVLSINQVIDDINLELTAINLALGGVI